MFYSAQTNGFYEPAIHGDNIPADAVKITAEQHQALMEGQSAGKVIAPDADGHPVLQDPPKPTPEQLEQAAEASRKAAYVAESDPLFFQVQRGIIKEQVWLDKIAEIKARYPKD